MSFKSNLIWLVGFFCTNERHFIMDYKELSKNIIENIGGKENISSLEHCSTRLRFKVKDTELINRSALKALDGVAGIKDQQNGIQVIIGQTVDDVYDVIIENYSFTEDNSKKVNPEKKDEKNVVIRAMNALADCFVPLIPALIAAGLMSAVVSVIDSFSLLDSTSSTYKLLDLISDAPLYFIAFMVANSSAKRFNVNPYISMSVAATFMMPELSNLVSKGSNYYSFFGVPFRLVIYSNSIVPIILTVLAQVYIEKVIKKIIPKMFATFLEPLLTYFILTILTLGLFGPIASYISDGLAFLMNAIVGQYTWLVCGILGATMILLISTGLHYSLMPIVIANFTMVGHDTFWAGPSFTSNLALAGAVLAFAIRTKDSKDKQIAGTTGFTALLGITEPAIYGVAFIHRKVLLAACIGGGLGGFLSGILGVNSYGMSPAGLPSLPVLAGSTFLNAIVSIIIAFVIGFAISFIFTGKEEK